MTLTMEQEFNLRRIADLLPDAGKDDLITVFLALQKQNYCLANTIKNLLKDHPSTTKEEERSLDFIRDTLSFHLGNAIKYICRRE